MGAKAQTGSGLGTGVGVGAGLDKGKNVNRAMINVKANDINNRIERNAVDYESDGREDERGLPAMAIIIGGSSIIIIIVGRLDRGNGGP